MKYVSHPLLQWDLTTNTWLFTEIEKTFLAKLNNCSHGNMKNVRSDRQMTKQEISETLPLSEKPKHTSHGSKVICSTIELWIDPYEISWQYYDCFNSL